MVTNIHERDLQATAAQVTALVYSLSSPEDRLWPRQWWPPMRFDRSLAVGAVGGHGPIRYTVDQYTPGESIVFRFTAPRGFHGTHAYYIEPIDDTHTRLKHVLEMTTSGIAPVSWALVYRPLHDALIEDSLNVAEASLRDETPTHEAWSWYVRLLRTVIARLMQRS